MAGNIDNSGVNFVAVRRSEIQFRETEIDGDAPRFFLRQTIGISSSQRFHQCALAMIDMASPRDDKMLFCHRAIANSESINQNLKRCHPERREGPLIC